MQGVVDADTHIAEPEAMWKLIDEKMAPRRPVLVGLPDDTWFGDRNALWLIDGNIFPKPAGKGSYRLVTPSAQKAEKVRGDIAIASREVADVGARLKRHGPARRRCPGDLPDAIFGLHYRRSGIGHGVVQGLQLMARRCLRKIERAVEVRGSVAAALHP